MVNETRLRKAAAISVIALLGLMSGASSAKPKPLLVSRAQSGEKASGPSYDPEISREGRFVAFTSDATNLSPDDTDNIRDVLVRDMATGAITLVSRADGASGTKGNDTSVDPAISPDGRFVAFASESDNLVPGLAPGRAQVFVRDLLAGTTTLVSRASGPGGAVGDFFSTNPSISADGRLVAFRSNSTNLDPADSNGRLDVFVRDLSAQTTNLVSRATGAAGTIGNDDSLNPRISADGSRVAFTSYASTLDRQHFADRGEVFVRDLTAATTTLVSRATGRRGAVANDEAGGATISADGSRIAFFSGATNLVPGRTQPSSDIFLRDLRSHKTSIVSRDLPVAKRLRPGGASSRSMSAKGNRLAFSYGFRTEERRAFERDRVFVANLSNGRLERVRGIVGADDKLDGEVGVSLSPDGRWLALEAASQLHADDRDTSWDIFVLHLSKQSP